MKSKSIPPWIVLVAAAAMAVVPGRASASDKRKIVGLMQVALGEGVSEKLGGTVEELMLLGLAESGRFKVIGRSDLATLLDHEKRKQAAGCTDDSCLAEIAGALGVDLVASASVSQLGAVKAITLKLIDSRSVTALARVGATVNRDEELPAVIHDLSAKAILMVPADPSPPAPAPVAPAPVANELSNKLIAVLPFDVSHAKQKLDADAQASLEETVRDAAATALGPRGWTVLTGQTMLQKLRDNNIDPAKCNEGDCQLATAREINVSCFISGSIQSVEGLLTASIRLIDTRTGAIKASISVEGEGVLALRRTFEARAPDFFAMGGPLTSSSFPDARTSAPAEPRAEDSPPTEPSSPRTPVPARVPEQLRTWRLSVTADYDGAYGSGLFVGGLEAEAKLSRRVALFFGGGVAAIPATSAVGLDFNTGLRFRFIDALPGLFLGVGAHLWVPAIDNDVGDATAYTDGLLTAELEVGYVFAWGRLFTLGVLGRAGAGLSFTGENVSFAGGVQLAPGICF